MRSELLDLDTSSRAALGKDVERHLRTLKIIHDHELPDGSKPDYIKAKTTWREPVTINSGVMALLDIMALIRSGETCLDSNKMQEVVNILSKSVIEVSTFVRSELHCVKDSVAPVYEKFRSMMIPVDAEDANWLQDPGVQAVVKHFNKEPDELKESLEGPSVSFRDVFHCFSEFFLLRICDFGFGDRFPATFTKRRQTYMME